MIRFLWEERLCDTENEACLTRTQQCAALVFPVLAFPSLKFTYFVF